MNMERFQKKKEDIYSLYHEDFISGIEVNSIIL